MDFLPSKLRWAIPIFSAAVASFWYARYKINASSRREEQIQQNCKNKAVSSDILTAFKLIQIFITVLDLDSDNIEIK